MDRRQRASRGDDRPDLAPARQPDHRAAAHKETVIVHSRVQKLATQNKAIHKVSAARQAAAKKRQKAKERRIRTFGYEPGTTKPKEIGRQISAKKYGWGSSEFACYDRLIMSESMWVITATNASSGAYGIPQSLPGSKMAAMGSDWRTNPATQIRWGLQYVKDVYGTPCSAWSFKQGHNWY